MVSYDKNYRDKTDVLYNLQLNHSGEREREERNECLQKKKKKRGETNKPQVSVCRRNTNIRQTRDITHQEKRETRDMMTSVAPASYYINVITLIHARMSRLKWVSSLS